MALRDTVKQWFETGDYPTQEQFNTFFESIFFKDELMAISDVDGLADLLNNLGAQQAVVINMVASKAYTIPAGFTISKVYVKTTYAAATFYMGTAEGLADVLDEVDIIGGATLPIAIDVPADEERVVWFSVPVVDFPANTQLKIYLQKI